MACLESLWKRMKLLPQIIIPASWADHEKTMNIVIADQAEETVRYEILSAIGSGGRREATYLLFIMHTMGFRKILLFACMLGCIAPLLFARDNNIVLRPTPGEEFVLAITDAQPSSEDEPAEIAGLIQTFNRVLWDDLSFSGFFRLAERSSYPPRPGAIRSGEDIPYDAWAILPSPVSFLSSGTLMPFVKVTGFGNVGLIGGRTACGPAGFRHETAEENLRTTICNERHGTDSRNRPSMGG